MRCFVIMPFGDVRVDPEAARRSQSLYEKWIKVAVESVPDPDREGECIKCSRADKHHRMGDVIEHVVEDLVEADIVIADLTGKNANVFYELGVRHAVNTGTILLAQSQDDVPFDMRRQRTFFYSYEPDSLLELQDNIRAAIREIAADRSRIDSPVRHYLYARESKKLRESTVPGYDVVKDILREMSRMRSDFTRELGQFKSLVRAVMPAPVSDSGGVTLAALQGQWRADDGHGFYCARVIDGELRVAYCFGAEDRLMAHLYEIRLVNQLLTARFAWFDGTFHGKLMFRIESVDRLAGGYWLDDELLGEVDWTSRHAGFEHLLTPLILVRAPDTTTPDWAEQYFSTRMWTFAEPR
jgi:hypothetical protein